MFKNEDIPGSRHTLESVATPLFILFFFAMSMLCGVLCMIGAFQPDAAGVNPFKDLPESLVFIFVGVLGFFMFFPWFMLLYFT